MISPRLSSATEGSFLCIPYFQQLEKVRLNQRYQRTDNNDNTLWITIFLENDFILCRILLAICSSKSFDATSWERANASLPCIDSVVSPPTLKFV